MGELPSQINENPKLKKTGTKVFYNKFGLLCCCCSVFQMRSSPRTDDTPTHVHPYNIHIHAYMTNATVIILCYEHVLY